MVVFSIIVYLALAGLSIMGNVKSQKASMTIGTCLSSFLAYWYAGINNVAVAIYFVLGGICIFFYAVFTDAEDVKTSGKKSKTVAGALAFFLGGCGMHRFYLKKNTSGLIYILFCWTLIPSIIGIIEAIRFFTMAHDKFDMSYNVRTATAPKKASGKATPQSPVTETRETAVTLDNSYFDICDEDDPQQNESVNERDGDNLNYRDIRLCGYKATAVGSIEDFSIVVKANGRAYTFKTKNGDICSCRSSSMRTPKYYEVT